MDYVNSLPPGPLGGDAVDQQLVASWVGKLTAWDGNLFLAANSDPGACTAVRTDCCALLLCVCAVLCAHNRCVRTTRASRQGLLHALQLPRLHARWRRHAYVQQHAACRTLRPRAGAAKVLGLLQTFKVGYAQARAREHPELQQAYADKVKGLQAAGGGGRGCRRRCVRRQHVLPPWLPAA